ncbi:MAG: hypothetical protein IH608_02285 [Proteobacteria bacterium]|nr:hypothetical protein [Pseudomonadota bacterium]
MKGISVLEGKYASTMDLWPLQGKEFTRNWLFWEHLRQGRFTTTRCTECGAEAFPPRVVCPECMGDHLEWVDLPAEGTVIDVTEEFVGVPLGFTAPLIHALVEVGKWTMFVRVEAEPGALKQGSKVKLKVFEVDSIPAEIGRELVEIPRVHYCFEAA